jgi:hypothetical protein
MVNRKKDPNSARKKAAGRAYTEANLLVCYRANFITLFSLCLKMALTKPFSPHKRK